MALTVLGISSSPRQDGNSDLLLKAALKGAADAGAAVEYVSLRGMKISPCVECNSCYRTGVCRIQDAFQDVFRKLLTVDRLIFATPVFFMGVCAQGKTFIDRNQCLWARKYILKQPLFPQGPPDRRGLVIAVGGSKSRKMFQSVQLTMQYFFDVVEIAYGANLFVNRVDDKGDILKHPTAMAEASRLGAELVTAVTPPGGKPVSVELFSE